MPAYLQLVQQVRQALRVGVLRAGDQLPTVKEVVSEVAVNPNTVMKAYRELEHEGLVQGRQGLRTFVVRPPAGPPPLGSGSWLKLGPSINSLGHGKLAGLTRVGEGEVATVSAEIRGYITGQVRVYKGERLMRSSFPL